MNVWVWQRVSGRTCECVGVWEPCMKRSFDRRLSELDARTIKALEEKYGDDVATMARDRRLNRMQHSEAQLKRLLCRLHEGAVSLPIGVVRARDLEAKAERSSMAKRSSFTPEEGSEEDGNGDSSEDEIEEKENEGDAKDGEKDEEKDGDTSDEFQSCSPSESDTNH